MLQHLPCSRSLHRWRAGVHLQQRPGAAVLCSPGGSPPAATRRRRAAWPAGRCGGEPLDAVDQGPSAPSNSSCGGESSRTSSRRTALLAAAAAAAALHGSGAGAAAAQPLAGEPPLLARLQQCWQALADAGGCAYLRPGPLRPVHLPRLEHIAVSAFPACIGDGCLLRLDVTYPQGGPGIGLFPPFPLVVLSGGFSISSAQYRSTAERLASWGYTVLRYDTLDLITQPLDDVVRVQLLRELLDWAQADAVMRRLADARAPVYLAGHSRGAKLSALAAARDPRVGCLALLDPVDITRYTPPLPDRYPSAVRALSLAPPGRPPLPVAIVGSAIPSDCAPPGNDYAAFAAAPRGPTWEVVLGNAGHFDFLDAPSGLQRALCASGDASDAAVRDVAAAVCVAWGEAMLRPPGQDVLSCLAARCELLEGQAEARQPQAARRGTWAQQLAALEVPPAAQPAAGATRAAPATAAGAPPRQGVRERLERVATNLVYQTQGEVAVTSRLRNI